jgi:leucyl aminopeptidase
MEFKILTKPSKKHTAYIIDSLGQLDLPEFAQGLDNEEKEYAVAAFDNEQTLVTINRYRYFVFILFLKTGKEDWQQREACRKAGADLQALCNKYKLSEVALTSLAGLAGAACLVAEGLALANYQFLKYKSEAAKMAHSLQRIHFTKNSATLKEAEQLSIVCDAIYKARTLVNEPVNFLTATQLSKEITTMGAEAGFKVTVLPKSRIEKEKMGGLLAVNLGSQEPPTFTIMEHSPKKALNKKPIVLVGKGIVYDTGGLSLKPTPNSMDRMKSDMSGAALVTAVMYAAARLQLPLHLVALVPATDNRPGENAYTPGDIITMYSGAKVEVLNTDAEGRMVLADALHWAKRYEPELVVDFATLTGAAATAVGEHGIVCMGTASETVKQQFRVSGFRQYERLVEYPLWEEYGEQIKSDIADIKNVGGATGGAITAGKFLEYFTAYPWMHFDIAGVSFNTAKKGYLPIGGTAYGVRMLIDFLTNYGKA